MREWEQDLAAALAGGAFLWAMMFALTTAAGLLS